MGQVSQSIYIPNFRVEDVGPVYHVFYVTMLANGGVLLALALAAAMLPALRALLARRPGGALPWLGLLAGFLVAAAFAGPTDGHWELDLLAALTLLEGDGRRGRGRSLQTAPAPVSAAEPPSRVPASLPGPLPAPAHLARPQIKSSQRERSGHSPGIHAVVVTYNSREQIE